MATPATEKRSTRRFSLQLPVKLQGQVSEVAHTRDVSSRGICFYTETRLTPGSDIEFTLTLPPEITMTDAIMVHCRGHVVRVEECGGGKLAIAAEISQYQFAAES